MAHPTRQVSRAQTITGLTILLALAGLAAGIYIRQFSFNPAVLEASRVEAPGGTGTAQPPGDSPLLAFLPTSLEPMTGYETFTPTTLSDKIDGKADTYLAAGFVGLQAQAFKAKDNPAELVQLYIFDMGQDTSAFSVFSLQKREGAAAMDLTPNSYRTRNALFFTVGPRYVEIVGSSANPKLLEAMESMARAIVAQAGPVSAATASGDARSLLPSEGLVKDSLALLASDAFAYARLDNVWTAGYRVGQADLTAFISARADAQQARDLADAYVRHLVENFAAKEIPVATTYPGLRLVDCDGVYEVVLARGRYLAGVHEALDRAAALELADRIIQRLAPVE